MSDALDYLIQKYDRPVPRYTSFPTAVQFTHEVSQDAYAAHLEALPKGEAVSLYVHIPFCHQLCHYCGCHTKVTNSYDAIARYVDAIIREIHRVGRSVPAGLPAGRIHFGGGTPNYAKSHDIERIITALSEYFVVSDLTEIDMECDPRLLDADKINAYSKMWMRRVSLGIQDFDPDVQEKINRVQPFELVQEKVEMLRGAGIDNINFDLITGLPGQTLGTVAKTVDLAVSLEPSRVSVFPYAHVPWMKKNQKLLEKYNMPDAKTRFVMNELVRSKLVYHGYKAIGIDHYALRGDSLLQKLGEGTLRRNFQGYTDDDASAIIGFGMSSITTLDGVYVQNTTDAPTYFNSVDEGAFPIARSCVLSQEDKVRRRLIERLMCDFEIRFADYFNIDPPIDLLFGLQNDGLVTFDAFSLKITEKGKAFARVVAACFDPYLNPDAQHHAKAV